MRTIVNGTFGAVLLLVGLTAYGAGATRQTADVIGQGPGGEVVSPNGAGIIRTGNGISAMLAMPTPTPGTYLYPDGNMFQETVEMGFPEVFTGWIFIFNSPADCTDPCSGDDLTNPAARGGAYNFAGHIVGGTKLNFAGSVAIGDAPFAGYPLDDPANAEVHLAVAPHGTVQPDLLPTQINTPIGTPAHWWLAFFLP